MNQQEGMALKEVIDGVKHLWLHRKGNEIHAAAYDVIRATWHGETLMPLIVKKQKYTNKWTLVIQLSPGIGYSEFKAKEQLFSDATGELY